MFEGNIRASIAVLTLLLLVSVSTVCQAQQGALPAGWQQMAPTDFAAAVRTLRAQNAFEKLSSGDAQALKAQG